MKSLFIIALISLTLLVPIIMYQWSLTPVHSWGGYLYSDNGDVIGMADYSSPSYWDKWTNSEDWQRYMADNTTPK